MAILSVARKIQAGNWHKKPFNLLVYLFTILTPLFELPQAISIFTQHDAGNVSLLTWTFLLISNIVWLAYALQEHIKPLIVSSVLYLFIEAAIVLGILTYR